MSILKNSYTDSIEASSKLKNKRREVEMMRKYVSQACGKWILSGEHTVLRGGKAILFPLKNFYFKMSYEPSNSPLKVAVLPSSQKVFLSFYKKVIKKAFEFFGKKASGTFYLNCEIPIASGLGSSAAFCLSLSRLLFQLGFLKKQHILKNAFELEHEFHGKSSGADVQAVFQNKALVFKNFNSVSLFKPQWKPCFYLRSTGKKSSSKNSIEKVHRFIKARPVQAKKIDKLMNTSVEGCLRALEMDKKKGLFLLKQSMDQALECFTEWGLCGKKVSQTIVEMKSQGALAAKPVGSGDGGFIVGLWEKPQKFSSKEKDLFIKG